MIDSNILKINNILSLNVSRETLQELEAYTNLIIEKNRLVNLISKSTEKVPLGLLKVLVEKLGFPWEGKDPKP